MMKVNELWRKNVFLFQDMHHIQKVKMQGTIDQQRKLIDFLQAKVENQGKKKKVLKRNPDSLNLCYSLCLPEKDLV